MNGKNSRKIDYGEHDELPENLAANSNVSSAGETTGMMPTPPRNRDELSAYQELAGMAIPKVAPGKPDSGETRRAKPYDQADIRPGI